MRRQMCLNRGYCNITWINFQVILQCGSQVMIGRLAQEFGGRVYHFYAALLPATRPVSVTADSSSLLRDWLATNPIRINGLQVTRKLTRDYHKERENNKMNKDNKIEVKTKKKRGKKYGYI